MAAAVASDKITLNFQWSGPSHWRGRAFHGNLSVGAIDLIFKDAQTKISVSVPDKLNPYTPQKLSFNCEGQFPESLEITIEQIQNLVIQAGIFEESSSQEKYRLRFTSELPAELEIGKTYSLQVTSWSKDNLSLTALLMQKEKLETLKMVFEACKFQ